MEGGGMGRGEGRDEGERSGEEGGEEWGVGVLLHAVCAHSVWMNCMDGQVSTLHLYFYS